MRNWKYGGSATTVVFLTSSILKWGIERPFTVEFVTEPHIPYPKMRNWKISQRALWFAIPRLWYPKMRNWKTISGTFPVKRIEASILKWGIESEIHGYLQVFAEGILKWGIERPPDEFEELKKSLGILKWGIERARRLTIPVPIL